MSWTPEAIEKWITEHQHRLDGPGQWIGTEPNVEPKDWDSARLRVLMAAAWPYEQAAGNQSIPAVWKTANDRDGYLCDRYYLPSTSRDMHLLEKDGVPVFGLEHRRPLDDYDVVGTSISYVVLLINFVKYLSMSGVPIRWRDRVPEDHPMIMVGGQSYCNPEVMAPVVDCVFCGEAEDEPGNGGLGQVLKMIDMFKQSGAWQSDRVACYRQMARTFNFLYFPRFVGVEYDQSPKAVAGYWADVDGMRMPFIKRHVRNLDSIPPLDAPPMLFTNPSMGSGDVEAQRGCPAWCSFCRLSWGSKPARQHSTEYTIDHARQVRNNLGGVEISPFGPDWPFVTNKNQVIKSLLENVTDKIDTVAQRVDDFISDDTYLILQAAGGARSITLGLEGVSQRMRDLVGKATSDEEVKEAVARGIRAGFRKFKLFMIVGLPGEDTGDVTRIMQLARDIADIRDSLAVDKVLIQFSFTPLLYEAQTPFQWFSCWPVPNYDLIDVASELRELKILFKIGTKSLRVTTPVLTPEGFKPLGTLQVGDDVVDPDGYSSKILNVWDNDTEPVYRLAFSDGSSVEAGAGHLWDVSKWTGVRRNGVQSAEERPYLVTTEQLREIAGTTAIGAPWLPGSPGLFHTDLGDGQQCTVDPYLLGVLLGDGSLGRNLKVTSADPEIVKAVRSALPEGMRLVPSRPKSAATDYSLSVSGGGSTLNPLAEQLRQLGLCCQRSWEKFVPGVYKLAPASVRLAVLQGLMDTDGCRVRGHGRFSSASRQLRDDVRWLARSLGFVATSRDAKQATFTLKDGTRRQGRTVFYCDVWDNGAGPLFRLPRKLAGVTERPKKRVLRSVEHVRDEQTRCIEVSAPSARFVVGDGEFIPTHNAEPNKAHFFQLCQRASRGAGEAVIDVLEDLDSGCWGGVPRDMIERLTTALRQHGFDGFNELFAEKEQGDMLGWEFISTGISRSLLWRTFESMREFALRTDSSTYDSKFDERYHGQEWADRCDERCLGTACGVCSGDDLKLRRDYLAVAELDRSVDVSALRTVDQSTIAVRVRARLHRPEGYRFADNEFRRHLIRRAGYRAQEKMGGPCVSKHSIWFASDAHGYRDWTCGVDYAEFGLTQRDVRSYGAWMVKVQEELQPWLAVEQWMWFPANVSMRSGSGVSYHSLELNEHPDTVLAWLRRWRESENIPMRLKSEGSYFASGVEEVNAKDYVEDVWLASNGTSVQLRMLARRRAGPYQVFQAVSGKTSWIAAAARPARTLEVFARQDDGEAGLACVSCGRAIPESLLGVPWHDEYCPRCADAAAGLILATSTE